jgi:two-component system, cell cycle response regulator
VAKPLQQGVGQARIILVDVSDSSREVMVRRLNAQGYVVEAAADPMSGAELALSAPPAAVIADFWMPGISGIQLCRLLRTEPATADVPVILRGDDDNPRNRFWAERAGAIGYVRKGRMGDLVRMLAKAVVKVESADEGFFLQLGGGAVDIRERIARYLDVALFESVIAAEVRSLSACGSFERLFDLFAQFLAQVIRYRWLALSMDVPRHFALHHHPDNADAAEQQARAALGVPEDEPPLRFVDEDPSSECVGPSIVVCSVPFGGAEVGRLALAPSTTDQRDTEQLVTLVARELGGPVRIAVLMDEQKLLATIDALTSLRNRRAFMELARVEINRAQRYELPLSLILVDVDHFKSVNDTYGHAAGDRVLSALGALMRQQLRTPDLASRWGGEEFVIALPNTDGAGGIVLAERLREAVEALDISHEGVPISVSTSLGLASLRTGESLEALVDRADRAMYMAKVNGRNRVVTDEAMAQDAITATGDVSYQSVSATTMGTSGPERQSAQADPVLYY